MLRRNDWALLHFTMPCRTPKVSVTNTSVSPSTTLSASGQSVFWQIVVAFMKTFPSWLARPLSWMTIRLTNALKRKWPAGWNGTNRVNSPELKSVRSKQGRPSYYKPSLKNAYQNCKNIIFPSDVASLTKSPSNPESKCCTLRSVR